jgi:hypothetical protein
MATTDAGEQMSATKAAVAMITADEIRNMSAAKQRVGDWWEGTV